MSGGGRRELGVLPPPLAGEGWGGGGKHESCCMPPPCPSPPSGGGDYTERGAPSASLPHLRHARDAAPEREACGMVRHPLREPRKPPPQRREPPAAHPR